MADESPLTFDGLLILPLSDTLLCLIFHCDETLPGEIDITNNWITCITNSLEIELLAFADIYYFQISELKCSGEFFGLISKSIQRCISAFFSTPYNH